MIFGYNFLQQMPQYFIKKGRKETIENSFKAFLFNRALLKKKRLRTILFKGMANITPFIRLKVRKRRRYTKYRIHPAKQDWGRRKALGSFIKVFKGHKSKDFFITLEKELGILQSGKSNIQIKRDEYHRLAYRWSPYKWKRKAKQLRWEKRKLEQYRRRKEQQAARQRGHTKRVQPKVLSQQELFEERTRKDIKDLEAAIASHKESWRKDRLKAYSVYLQKELKEKKFETKVSHEDVPQKKVENFAKGHNIVRMKQWRNRK